jgi:hypothetical protein
VTTGGTVEGAIYVEMSRPPQSRGEIQFSNFRGEKSKTKSARVHDYQLFFYDYQLYKPESGWILMHSLSRVLSHKGEAQHNGWMMR